MNTHALTGTAPPEVSAITISPVTEAPRRKRRVAPAQTMTLADDVAGLEATLAKSLGVPAGADGYAPDLFVKSIKAIHDKLHEVRDALTTRQAELDKIEMALRAREKAVEAREQRVAGLVALEAASLLTARPARPWWHWWR